MIVYFAINGTPGERWNPTQAAAKAAKAPFEDRKVAEDGRDGICNLLNSVEFECFSKGGEFTPDRTFLPPAEQIEEAQPAPTITQPTLEAIAAKVSAFKASEIEDFILNHATVAQTENIMACIGTRFAELAKGARV